MRALAPALTLRTLLVAVGVVAFVVRLPYMVGPVYARYVPDWGVYWVISYDLQHGAGFHRATELRTPGYPLILAGISYLPGSLDHGVVVVQHLIGIAVTLAVVWAAWRYFGRLAAILTAVIGMTSPVFFNLEGNMMPDFLVGAFAIVGALLLARALEAPAPRLRLVAAAGVSFGLAALVKPVGQALVLMALVPLLVDPRRLRGAIRAGLVLAGCLLVTISPWLVRNAVVWGDVRLSTQDAAGLWLREFDWDKRPVPTNDAEGRLAKRLFDKTVIKDDPAATPTYTNEYVLEALGSPPYSYSEQKATGIMRRVALQAIRDAPRVYLDGTLTNVKKLARVEYDAFLARYETQAKEQKVEPILPTRLSRASFALSERLVRWWKFLSLGFVSVFLLLLTRSRRQRVGVLSLGVAWLAVEGATAATAYPDTRYAAELEPLLWVLGSAGAALVLRALVRQVRTGLRAAK